MSRSNSCCREPERSSSSSRSWVLRSSASLRPTSSVSIASRAFSRRTSPSGVWGSFPPAPFSSGCSRAMRVLSGSVALLRSGAALGHAAPVLEVFVAALHERAEGGEVLAEHRGAQPLDRLGESLERLGAVVVQALDLVVQLRALLRYAARHVQLRIEGGGGHARELRGRLPALSERGEEGDVERVAEAQHVGDQPV